MADNNYTLAYAYSDSPLGPFTYGGTLIDGRAPENGHPTAHPRGNTHGSLFCIENKMVNGTSLNRKYFLVYHRQTGSDEYHRQTMAAPLSVHVEPGKGGIVTIDQAEYTSEGFRTRGLNPRQPIPAALSCYYTGGAIVTDSAVTNIRNGSVVGYKYLNLDSCARYCHLDLTLKPLNPQTLKLSIEIFLDHPVSGRKIGQQSLSVKPSNPQTISIPVRLKKQTGKHALYLVFHSDDAEPICRLTTLQLKQ